MYLFLSSANMLNVYLHTIHINKQIESEMFYIVYDKNKGT
jgi:hypothetical protein